MNKRISPKFVYATLLPTGYVKIGRGQGKRDTAASTYFAEPVKVIGRWYTNDPVTDERQAHSACEQYKVKSENAKELFFGPAIAIVKTIEKELGPNMVKTKHIRELAIKCLADDKLCWSTPLRGVVWSESGTMSHCCDLRRAQSEYGLIKWLNKKLSYKERQVFFAYCDLYDPRTRPWADIWMELTKAIRSVIKQHADAEQCGKTLRVGSAKAQRLNSNINAMAHRPSELLYYHALSVRLDEYKLSKHYWAKRRAHYQDKRRARQSEAA